MSARQPIDPAWWNTEHIDGVPMRHALAERDIKAVFQFLHRRGWSWGAIAQATDIGEQRVREIASGKRRMQQYDVYVRVAQGLQIPREYLGVGLETPPSPASPDRAMADPTVLSTHWRGILQSLAERTNEWGFQSALDMVRHHVSLLDLQRRAISTDSQLLAVQAEWSEFASWLADNCAAYSDAAGWIKRAQTQAEESEDRTLVAYILMRRAQQTAERGDFATAAVLAEAARSGGILRPRTLALCYVREAHAHAGDGNVSRARIAIDNAMASVDRAADHGHDPQDGHCTYQYVEAYEGYCRLLLGDASAAIAKLEETLHDWPNGMLQDEVLWRAWLASAYTTAGRLQDAGVEGLLALELCQATGSARARRVLDQLAGRMISGGGQTEAEPFLAAHRVLAIKATRRMG